MRWFRLAARMPELDSGQDEARHPVLLRALRLPQGSPIFHNEPDSMKDIPEGRGSSPAGALVNGSPSDVARDSNPGSAAPGRVVHCKRDAYDVYIGRTARRNGAFGNPFVMRSEAERQTVIDKFEAYARGAIAFDPAFRQRVRELHGKVLGCWCAPKACHGDVLLKLAAELHAGTDGDSGAV